MRVRRSHPTVLAALALLCLVSVAGAADEPKPFVGLSPLDPGEPGDRDASRMARLAGMGRVLLGTAPIDWGTLEPRRPTTKGPSYAWDVLDDALLVWQLAGLDPVVVLSPRSPWASMKAENAKWPLELRAKLPRGEAAAAQREATGAAPPKDETWREWQRFVRDLVERYDGDGKGDMPGLRRPLRYVQLLDRADLPTSWVGSSHQYLRLLHHAQAGAKVAYDGIRLVAGAIDLRGTGHPPHPDPHEWQRRMRTMLPDAPQGARLEMERAFEIATDLLGMPQLYDVITQVGAGNHDDDVANLRFVRRTLDEAGGSSVALWLVQNPTRKLDAPRRPDVTAPSRDELRVRQRWLPAARNPRHADHPRALAWVRRGQAYDVVRSVCHARASGADAVVFLAPWDELPRAVRRPGCANQGFVGMTPGEARERRTPSWYALRQLNQLVAGHRTVREISIRRNAGARVVFSFPDPDSQPWVAVLLGDPRWTWAGTPGQTVPTQSVALAVPSGRYRLIPCQLGPDAPREREVRSEEGILRLGLGPAPLYLIPVK